MTGTLRYDAADLARHRRIARAAVIAAATVATLAGVTGTAQAALVSVKRTDVPWVDTSLPKVPGGIAAHTDYVLSIAADPGEPNAVVVERTPAAMLVRDAVPISAGAGCEPVDQTSVRCPTPLGAGASFVQQRIGAVMLGDGDDRFDGPPPSLPGVGQGEVDGGAGDDIIVDAARALGGTGHDRLVAMVAEGGPGDDRIEAAKSDGGDGNDVLTPLRDVAAAEQHGAAGDDVLTGGPAGDVLDGGDGADRLDGGDGADRLLPGPGADVIDGGAGADTVDLTYATNGVRVDLSAAGPVDPTGEGDAMSAIESARSGSGDDVLIGADGDSTLRAGAGNDRLEGRGDRDLLDGGPGDDVLLGAAADDLLVGGSGADTIGGGAGKDDLVAGSAEIDVAARRSDSPRADKTADRLAGGAGADMLRLDDGDRGDGGAGNDTLVTRRRPARLACGGGRHDVLDGPVLAPPDCERVAVLGDTISAHLRLRRGVAAIRVPSFLGPEEPTVVRLILRVGGRVVARARGSVPDGSARTLRLIVAPRDRRMLGRARSVLLVVIASDSTSTERDTVMLRVRGP